MTKVEKEQIKTRVNGIALVDFFSDSTLTIVLSGRSFVENSAPSFVKQAFFPPSFRDA